MYSNTEPFIWFHSSYWIIITLWNEIKALMLMEQHNIHCILVCLLHGPALIQLKVKCAQWKILYSIKTVYVRLGKCIQQCATKTVNHVVKRNEILLIDVRHLPRHLLLPPSETVYYQAPAAWRINYRHMRRCTLPSGSVDCTNHCNGLLSFQLHVLFTTHQSYLNPRRSSILINLRENRLL